MHCSTRCYRILAAMLLVGVVYAGPASLTRPPRGWSSQGVFDCELDCSAGMDTCLSEALMRKMADVLAQPEFQKRAYDWLLMGDCWSDNIRNVHGRLVANETRFPGGIKAVADYAHRRGLYLALYMEIGQRSTNNMPGLHGHVTDDVKALISWGVDMIYVDTQMAKSHDVHADFMELRHAITASGSQLKVACAWPEFLIDHGVKPDYDDVRELCDVYRATHEMVTSSSWSDVLRTATFYGNDGTHASLGGGQKWIDMGMLLIGQGDLNLNQWEAQMAIWSMYNSAMFVSSDLANIAAEVKTAMLLSELQSIDEDTLDQRPSYSVKNTHLHIWHRYASYGDNIVLLVNSNTEAPVNFTSALSHVGVTMYPAYLVNDVINVVSYGQIFVTDVMNIRVAPSSAVLLRCVSEH